MSAKSRMLFLAAAAGAVLACGNAIASPNIVQNSSFEANAPASGFYNPFGTVGNATDWTYVDGPLALNDGGYEEGNNADGGLGYTPNTIDGSNHWITLRDSEAVYQDLGTTVVNNMTGNLSLSQGAQYNAAPGGVTISLWAGAPGAGGSVELSSQTFAPLTQTYTIGVPSNSLPSTTDTGSLTTGTGNAGAELYLEIQQDGVPSIADNVLIDDVTLNLTSSAVPEPASLGILGIGGLMLLRRRARVH